ncbi:MAG: 6-phosphogluconolactonase [Gemmatimonadaceae bacterium]|nr:6-phosphogluconolactonase [Gemmatimonadaceae bacterium]
MSETPFRVLDTPQQIGTLVAGRILAGIAEAAREGRRYLLGLPTGRTPRPVYAAMAAQLARTPQSLAHVTLVMMDEYLVEEDGGYAYALEPGAPSCHEFTRTEIVDQLNAALPGAGAHLREASVWYPDPRDPADYDAQIEAAGGIDFFLLASGASDGHVAFNPPGSARDSRSRVVELSEETRRDNLLTFPALGTLADVPRYGVTVGIATIADAREAVMVAWGKGKQETVQWMRATSTYEPGWPATVIHECRRAGLLVDRAAAS